MRILGKVAIVTGGGRGLGRAFALGLARQGVDVAVTSRSQTVLDQVVSAIVAMGRRGLAVRVDLTNEASVQGMVETTLKEFGKVDILVNNSGL